MAKWRGVGYNTAILLDVVRNCKDIAESIGDYLTDSELKGREITIRHIGASRKEIELIEDKADKWDEKETPFVPTEQEFIRNYDENLVGKCKCGNTVYEHTKYCCDCGQKLKWESDVE